MAPAIALDHKEPAAIKARLIEGDLAAFSADGGLVVVWRGHPVGKETLAMWVQYAGGTLPAKVSERRKFLKRGLAELERLAITAGCTEIFIDGKRAWRTALVGYRQIKKSGNFAVFVKAL